MNDTKLLTLDNGLKVFIYANTKKSLNYVSLITNLGGITDKLEDGTRIIPGTAHLLEHYVCENNKYGIIEKELMKNKAINANASTNDKRTSYFFETIENLENLIKILIDGIYNVQFTQDRLNKTKIPVYSEIRDSKNRIREELYNTKMKSLFNIIPNTLGKKEDIDKIDYKYLERIYKNTYVPSNQLLVIGGNFKIDSIVKLINKIYDNYSFKKMLKPINEYESSKIYIKESTLEEITNETYALYKISLNNYTNEELYKFDFYLNFYINTIFSKYSDINNQLKENNVIMNNIGYNLYRFKNCYVIEVSAYTKNDKKFIDIIDKHIKNINVTEESFELQKEEIKTRISVRKDDMMNYIYSNIDNIISFNYFNIDTIKTIDKFNYKEYLENIQKINFNNKSIIFIKEKEIKNE